MCVTSSAVQRSSRNKLERQRQPSIARTFRHAEHPARHPHPRPQRSPTGPNPRRPLAAGAPQ
eukprot:4162563-Prymnesium_polylepis.1